MIVAFGHRPITHFGLAVRGGLRVHGTRPLRGYRVRMVAYRSRLHGHGADGLRVSCRTEPCRSLTSCRRCRLASGNNRRSGCDFLLDRSGGRDTRSARYPPIRPSRHGVRSSRRRLCNSAKIIEPSSPSDLRLICCASGRSGPYSPVSSLHRTTMRLENERILPRFPTRLATIAQVRQPASTRHDPWVRSSELSLIIPIVSTERLSFPGS